MLKNYIKIAIRNIVRQKAYSLINIVGLAVGMACCIIIMLWVSDELTYDRFHQNADRIYRVASEFPYEIHGKNKAPITMGPMAQALLDEYPEVLAVARFIDYNEVLITMDEQSHLEDNVYFADPEIFDIFTLPLVEGSPQFALNDPSSVIISQRIAQKYFGKSNPIGEIIKYKDERELSVTGVWLKRSQDCV